MAARDLAPAVLVACRYNYLNIDVGHDGAPYGLATSIGGILLAPAPVVLSPCGSPFEEISHSCLGIALFGPRRGDLCPVGDR